MSDIAIRVDHVSKEYRLGMIGGTTLRADLQRLWARMRGKGDPNAKIGTDQTRIGERFLALDDVSFEVKKGEALGIIGHNGAGKSTLLKLLARVTAPTKGTIAYNGRIASMLEVGTGFHGELTGRENIYMNGAILGMRKAEIDRKLDEIIAFAEMEKFIDTPVKRYSSGMYVKLAFAVAAHLDAEIMIMDEVLAVGDMKFQQKCLGKMDDAANNEGKTVLYVSHNMGTIRQLCSRCMVMEHGHLIYGGEADHAISLYTGLIKVSPHTVDLSQIVRVRDNLSLCLRLLSLEFVNHDIAQYEFGEKIKVIIKFRCDRSITTLHFRFTVRYADNTPATMITSSTPVSVPAGDAHQVEITADISSLAPGKYHFKLTAYEVNEFGTDLYYDVVDSGIDIEILPTLQFNNGMEWNHMWWGHCVSAPLQIRML